jgi:hypothetical protein
MIYYLAIYDILLDKTTVFASRNDASVAMKALLCIDESNVLHQ